MKRCGIRGRIRPLLPLNQNVPSLPQAVGAAAHRRAVRMKNPGPLIEGKIKVLVLVSFHAGCPLCQKLTG